MMREKNQKNYSAIFDMNTAQKITILTVSPTAELGGGTTIMNSLLVGLDQNSFHLAVFFPEGGPAVSALSSLRNDIKLYTPHSHSFFATVRHLVVLLRENHFDIVHAHGTRAAFWVKCAFLFLPKCPKFIYTLHGLHLIYRAPWQRFPILILERLGNRLVDRLVCVSETVEEMAKKYTLIHPSRIVLIRNGIDLEKFQNPKPMHRIGAEAPEDALVITAIQRLVYPKDVFTIIKAFEAVHAKASRAMLVIVGDGPDASALKAYAEELRLSDKIFFLGNRTDIPEILALSHMVILSSRFESLGLSLIEGMAAGKPVIGTDVDGIREVIHNGENGFLVPFQDADALADAIVLLLRDAKLRIAMGERGRSMAREKYSFSRMQNQYRHLYESAL